MMTPSHFLMTAALDGLLKWRGVRPQTAALLAGSVLPDLPLYVLSASYIGWNYVVAPALLGATVPAEHIFGARYDTLFFTDPVWITSHNLLHAPLVLIGLSLLGAWGVRRENRWGSAMLWFVAGCALHSGVDILTHRDDGPLLLFPFDAVLRFAAPVSYWDRRYGAAIFAPLERALDVAIIAAFAVRWAGLRLRRMRQA